MSNGMSCTFIPSKGKEVLNQLKKEFGYDIAREVFLRAAVNTKFKETYKKTLRLTPEGVVSFESLLGNREIQKFVGEEKILNSLNKPYLTVENTRDNYISALESANAFNTTNSARDNYIATVEYVGDNKLKVVVQRKTKEAINKFRDQYSTQNLNQRLADIFKPLGVTVGQLTEAELKAGRVGVTDFSSAQDIANGFATLIRVANNDEGEAAISEEFSHLIVGIFREEPIVERCINILQDDIEAMRDILGEKDFISTVDFYTDEEGEVDWAMVAEETLGHVLRKNLVESNDNVKTPKPSLFKRFINWIKSAFKRYSVNDIRDAVTEVDTLMNDLAKSILRGTREITREDIYRSQRNARLNALSDRIERNIDILNESRKTEIKRDKISKGRIASLDITIEQLTQHATQDADTVEGIFNYALEAVTRLKGVEQSLIRVEDNPDLSFQEVFSNLRVANSYVKSYANFIDRMYKAINEESKEEDDLFDRTFTVNGREYNIKGVIDELNALSRNISGRYIELAVPKFIEFLKPYYGESFRIPSGKHAGELITVDDLIKEARNGDISLMDRWLDSMSDSSDVALQLINKVVMKYKDKARLETMDYFRKIIALRQEAERLGITNFDWMFERDAEGNMSGNYVSDVNYAEYERRRLEYEKHLNETYGENPTGPEAVAKVEARKAWRAENSLTLVGPPQPNPRKYPGARLTDNQREILNKFIALKQIFDNKYPESRVQANKAIQIRKSTGQRVLGSLSNPLSAFEVIKEAAAASLLEREDDDQIFGNSIARGLRDFDGKEYLTLPVLYTTRLKNPNELSTDVFGSLMAYAYSACHYEQMDEIIDTLEVGKEVLSSKNRKVTKMSGEKRLIEKLTRKGETITSEIQEGVTNIEAKLQDFLECQVYGRYLKEGGTFDIFGARINHNKATSLILKFSSMTQMGFNWLANLANVTTGLCMQNIEAFAGQFFKPGQLAKADAAYAAALPEFFSELGARYKTSDLALFCDLFNVRQDFGSKARRATQRKNLLLRVFGSHIAFLGQTCGDHWLYTRTAIAMCMNKNVYVNGRKMNLWEAVKSCIKEDENGIRYVDRDAIKDENGNPISISDISREIAHINQICFGIYNDDDANAANRVALGRLLQQYRKWMKIQYNRRFQGGQQNLATNTWEEGYYITVGRIFNELLRGERQLGHLQLTEDEKYNVKRAITELVQAFAVFCLANLVSWPDDKDRPYMLKLAEYASKRLKHELFGLIPWISMPQELLKTIKSPMPAAGWALNCFNLVNSALTPSDWIDELQSGPYKGMTKVEKNFIKSPLPFLPWILQVKKFAGGLDTSIQYYMRPVAY